MSCRTLLEGEISHFLIIYLKTYVYLRGFFFRASLDHFMESPHEPDGLVPLSRAKSRDLLRTLKFQNKPKSDNLQYSKDYENKVKAYPLCISTPCKTFRLLHVGRSKGGRGQSKGNVIPRKFPEKLVKLFP